MSTLTAIQHHTGSPHAIRQEKDIKVIQIVKEDIQLSLFTENMTIENPKESTPKPP